MSKATSLESEFLTDPQFLFLPTPHQASQANSVTPQPRSSSHHLLPGLTQFPIPLLPLPIYSPPKPDSAIPLLKTFQWLSITTEPLRNPYKALYGLASPHLIACLCSLCILHLWFSPQLTQLALPCLGAHSHGPHSSLTHSSSPTDHLPSDFLAILQASLHRGFL